VLSQEALAAAPGAQVVLLGAGLDSRAWRCAPPTLAAAVYEVDRADVLAAKAAVFAAMRGGTPPLTLAQRYAAVTADLCTDDWPSALRAAGHDADVPTVWLLEGLLYYMPEPDVARLLRACAAASAPGSALVASCVNTPALVRARSSGRSAAMRSFQSAVDAPEAYFGAAGWRVTGAPRPGDPGCSYGGRHAAPEADAADGSKPASYYVRAVLA
jgi:methyltransferase (TIGR00027 family)